MNSVPATPWHRASYDRFLHRRLPDLLASRPGLVGCRAEYTSDSTCRIALQARAGEHDFEVVYGSVPAPDEEGVFRVAGLDIESRPILVPAGAWSERVSGDGAPVVVSPLARADDLSQARIDCVGEQLYDFVADRLGQLPGEIALDEELLRTLAPVAAWVRAFLAESAQRLNDTNYLDRATHLRRLLIPDMESVFTPGHFGRTCMFETPEGPNVGRVLTISRGTEIRESRLVIVDDDPVAGLGLTAACIPFLEHDDGNRVLMGANMMRQWLPASESEPALIQTGYEPAEADFWCGRNLLTAYLSWDGYAFEDSLVVSESAARKLACPQPLEPGDKLSDRHGIKGVVSRVFPDGDMPHLADGTPVELIFSVSGLPSRWSMGPLREAALSHVARQHGRAAIIPPYGAPSDDELREQLRAADLPENGMFNLVDGDTSLRRSATAGWVYWGCLNHLARGKLHAATSPGDRAQRLGQMATQALREAGAEAVIQELTNTYSANRDDAASLGERVAAGTLQPSLPPAPGFDNLASRLAIAGIGVEVGDDGVTFFLHNESAETLELSQPVPHPWLPDRNLDTIGIDGDLLPYDRVEDANARLAQLVDGGAPESLVDEARERLSLAVSSYCDELVAPGHLTFDTPVQFSGRAVLVPGPDLPVDQLGLPEDLAWTLFGPQVSTELDEGDSVQQRSKSAREALALVMADAWVILNRPFSIEPVTMLAFQPVLCPGNAIRVHPLASQLMDADFDGDQGAVYVPLTPGAICEAREKLSIAGHLRRDPDLVADLCPGKDALYGLASLSRSAAGRESIAATIDAEPELSDGIWTRHGVIRSLRALIARSGTDAALAAADALMRLGFTAARREGASLGPFLGTSLELPGAPAGNDFDQWQAYMEEARGLVARFRDYDDDDVGAVCLLSHSGARATTHQVASLFAPGGPVRDATGGLFFVRHCWREGLTAPEVQARVVGARRGLATMHAQVAALERENDIRSRAGGYGVLSRARRCNRPGIAFARAALRGEIDPLSDDYARLFVGLAPPC